MPKKRPLLALVLLLTAFCPAAHAKTVVPMPLTLKTDALKNQSVYTRVNGYDRKTNLLTVSLYEVETFRREDIDALNVGDVLQTDGQTIPVKSIERGALDVSVNGGSYEYKEGTAWLVDANDGYRVQRYNETVWLPVGTLTFPPANDFLVLDGIDGTGSTRDLPCVMPLPEFIDLIAESKEGYEVGFSIDNAYLLIDGNGRPVGIQRFYVPWQ